MDGFTEAVEALVGQDAGATAPASPPASASVPADSGSTSSTAPASATPDPAPSAPASGDPPPATVPKAATPGPAAKPADPAGTPATSPWPKAATAAIREARDQNRALREQYEWLPTEHVSAIRGFYESWRQDPIAALQTQVAELLKHGTYGPRLRALMGVDDTGRPDEEPGPDYRNAETGEPAYSPQQLKKWQAWKDRQVRTGLDERLAPIEQHLAAQRDREQREAMAREVEAQRAKSAEKAKSILAELRADPTFVANEPAIRERYKALVEVMPGEAAIYRAFSEVIRGSVLPAASDAARTDLAASLSAKARLTSLRPTRAGAAPGPMKPPADFDEAAARIFGAR